VLKVLLVLIVLGIAVYTMVRVTQRRGANPPSKGPLAGSRQTRSSGPLGPDDDEEFLRELDRKRRRGDGAGGG
jgi:hypothetical protein